MDYEKIGGFIAFSRKKKGLTQKELADLLGITDRAVSKWERGKGAPDISLLECLSKALDISIIELLKGEKFEKEKKIETNELLYSINYTRNYFKEKIYNIFNIVIITLIIILILLIIFNNIKINILFNQHYYPNIVFVDGKNVFEEVESKTKLLKEKQTTYEIKKYDEILNIINKFIEEDKKIYNKNYYTYNDIKKINQNSNNDNFNNLLNQTVNNITNDIDWNDNIYYFETSYFDEKHKIDNFVNNCYRYNYIHNIEENIGNIVKNLIYDKYYIYSLILEDILNGGVVNE